jgi:CDP-4-dehydro-6-deoxyglucose reductase
LWQGRVVASERLARDVMAVHLALTASTAMAYRAGQYVRVHLRDGRRRDLSMAHVCRGDNRLELWVRYAGGPFTDYVFTGLAPGDVWRLEGPLGAAGLRDENGPILVAGGGTGIGPVRAIAQALAAHQPGRRAIVLAGAREPEQLLCHAELRDWARAGRGRAYWPVVTQGGGDGGVATGPPDALIDQWASDLSAWVAHLFGPRAMVEAVARRVRAYGVSEEALRGDAFTPGALDLDRD